MKFRCHREKSLSVLVLKKVQVPIPNLLPPKKVCRSHVVSTLVLQYTETETVAIEKKVCPC